MTISITSVPPGAEVRLSGEKVSRGTTPHKLTLDRADGEVVVVLQAPGYKEKRKSVKTSTDSMIEITLDKARIPDVKKEPKKEPRKGPADDDDVLAPSFD